MSKRAGQRHLRAGRRAGALAALLCGRTYDSRFVVRYGLLVERISPATNIFRVAVSGGRLHLDLVEFRMLGLPVPSFLRPRCSAVETGDDGTFTFDVSVSLPGLGPVIRYLGWLAPIGSE